MQRKIEIIWEDDELLVVNKPKGMLTHPTDKNPDGTLVNALLEHCGGKLSNVGGDLRRGIVHRLDKNTAGLMLAAKTDEAHENLATQIKEKTAVRKYLAVALGNFTEEQGVIDKPLAKHLGKTVKVYATEKGAPAVTHYKVLEYFQGAALLELELKTGRTHQIRVHLSSINRPVFGDTMYGAKGFGKFAKIKTNEQVLQSYYLRFTHPKSAATMEFELEPCQWDADLTKVLEILRRDYK